MVFNPTSDFLFFAKLRLEITNIWCGVSGNWLLDGPPWPKMVGFCDLLGTLYAPVLKILSVNKKIHRPSKFLYFHISRNWRCVSIKKWCQNWFYSIMSRKAGKLLSSFLLDLFLIFVYILTENIIVHKDIQRQFYRQFGKSPQTSRVLGNKGNENSSSWCWASPFELRYFKSI